MRKVGIGIIGCGTISTAYLKAAQRFPVMEIKALADMRSEVAERQGAAFGLPGMRVDQLLKRDDVEIVINLTVPLAHTDVSLAVLNAGKHVHSEKPLGINVAEARKVMDLAAQKNLRVGCAPDTFLGGGHQTARKLIDDGAIGTPVAGSAFFGCPGHERWHPAPGFYYLRGGGPMLDMGPYYITDLVQLLGPVASVMGSTARARSERLVTSQPMNGALIPVEVATHVAGTLEFESGAVVSIAMSFDVPKHRHAPIEIYGDKGSMLVPDPNRFGGEVQVAKTGGEWEPVALTHGHVEGEFRSIGVDPDLCASMIRGWLKAEGFEVRIETTTAAFADPAIHDLSLIVPIYTMSTIEKAEALNLCAAVRSGVGLAGHHGGMCDAFRESVDYQFMCGGQWVAHPGNIIDYRVDLTKPDDPIMKGLKSFEHRSEQYYMHVDPAIEVLATTTFSGEHAPWIEGVVMPLVWKKRYGAGRVFYSSLGHRAYELDVPEIRTLMTRGMLWAARE